MVCALSVYFGRGYLPPELGKLKRALAILGACERISWLLLRLAHLALYALLFGFAILAFTASQCTKELKEYSYLLIVVGVT